MHQTFPDHSLYGMIIILVLHTLELIQLNPCCHVPPSSISLLSPDSIQRSRHSSICCIFLSPKSPDYRVDGFKPSFQYQASSQKAATFNLKQNRVKNLCSPPFPCGTAETEKQLSQKLVRLWTPRALQPSPQSLV